nr:glycosyl hydrolases family 31 protein [Tanacetum cinerariifolium]
MDFRGRPPFICFASELEYRHSLSPSPWRTWLGRLATAKTVSKHPCCSRKGVWLLLKQYPNTPVAAEMVFDYSFNNQPKPIKSPLKTTVPSKVDDIIWVAFNLGPDSDIDHHDSCTGSPTANKWTPAPADPVKYYIELVSSLQGWVVTVMTLMSLRPLAASPFITYKSFEIDAISVDVYFPSENCSSLFNYSIAVSVGYGSHVRFDAPADHINVHFREGNVLALQKEA